MKRKTAFISVTLIIMLIVSRFMIRIVDATAQIDDDITVLVHYDLRFTGDKGRGDLQ